MKAFEAITAVSSLNSGAPSLIESTVFFKIEPSGFTLKTLAPLPEPFESWVWPLFRWILLTDSDLIFLTLTFYFGEDSKGSKAWRHASVYRTTGGGWSSEPLPNAFPFTRIKGGCCSMLVRPLGPKPGFCYETEVETKKGLFPLSSVGVFRFLFPLCCLSQISLAPSRSFWYSAISDSFWQGYMSS